MCKQITDSLVSNSSSACLYLQYRALIKEKLVKVSKLKAWHTVGSPMALYLLSVFPQEGVGFRTLVLLARPAKNWRSARQREVEESFTELRFQKEMGQAKRCKGSNGYGIWVLFLALGHLCKGDLQT